MFIGTHFNLKRCSSHKRELLQNRPGLRPGTCKRMLLMCLPANSSVARGGLPGPRSTDSLNACEILHNIPLFQGPGQNLSFCSNIRILLDDEKTFWIHM